MGKLFMLTTLLIVILVSGCNDSSGPSQDPGIHGWTVGDASGNAPLILKTEDGTTWTAQAADLTVPGSSLNSISVVDSLTAWAAGGLSEGFGVVLKTTDGGETWLRMGNESTIPSGTLCVKAFSSDAAWVGGGDNSIYYTSDGGVTWQNMADPAYQDCSWQGINAISPTNIWVCGGTEQQGVILHTSDGGALWTSHAESMLTGWMMISIAAYDSQNIWAVGHGFTILKSTDGGIDWELVTPDSLQASGNDANGLTVLSPSDVWVVLDYGNIWRTANGGETWDFQEVPTGVEGFFMLRISATSYSTAWVSGYSGFGQPEGVLLHTTDGGTSWVRQDDGTIPGLWDIGFVGEYN